MYPERQSLRSEQDAVFRCRDEGSRRAPVRWSRADGAALPSRATDDRGRLTILGIRVDDSGTYLCEAVGVPSGGGTSRTSKAAVLQVQPCK